MFNAYAAPKQGAPFQKFQYDPGRLNADEVEIKVAYCGICHSDLSMRDNEWGMTQYPFVGGHEVAGTVAAVGERVPHLKVGDTVGLGWFSQSCMHCDYCISGRHNLCATAEGVIVGRHGGFADRVRAHWGWVTKLPAGVDPKTAGPLFCGGITVFNPIVQHDLAPTARVGVIGIGGLGHMAIKFLDKWGCEVTAFSTSADKKAEAMSFGADEFVNTKDAGALEKVKGKFDLIINTTNANLNWQEYVGALASGGTLHTVGAVTGNFGVIGFSLIAGQKSLAGSPLGNPATVRKMLDFCARHKIEPITEHYKMSQINDAFEKLEHGSPRYRLVLEAD
ncbi:MAG: alcohol dehydrogenase catalytic domain-containing protein [Planctomycetes bacterium]|nr:alcohol dehydrogenase catalytic domain-containing protein [Planctomycetota bacterium]